MNNTFKEVRYYNIFGPVKVTFTFAGQMNEGDFALFKNNYLCKKEVDKYKLGTRPIGWVNEVRETAKEWGVENEVSSSNNR